MLVTGSGCILKWHPDIELRNRSEASPGQSRLRPRLTNWQVVWGRIFFAQAAGGVLQAAAYYT